MNSQTDQKDIEVGQPEAEQNPLITELKKNIVGKITTWMEKQGEVKVQEESMKAFIRVKDALPQGAGKDLLAKLEPMQVASGKALDVITHVQDVGWEIAKGLLIGEAPWIVVIPGNVNSIVQAKSLEWGSKGVEWVIKTATGSTETPFAQQIQELTESIIAGPVKPPAMPSAV